MTEKQFKKLMVRFRNMCILDYEAKNENYIFETKPIVYFRVSYANKDAFKKLGGKWDQSRKLWYVDPNRVSLKKFNYYVKV